MNTEKPHFFARRIQDFQRQNARSIECTICGNGPWFTSPARLLDHAKTDHPEIALHAPDGTKWKQYASESSRMAPKTVRMQVPEPQSRISKASSNESMRPNAGDDSISRSTASRPTSSANQTKQSGAKIEDLGLLSLSVEPNGRAPNRLKRPTGDPAHQGRTGRADTDFREDKREAFSSNQKPKGQARTQFSLRDADHGRNRKGNIQRLYDPAVDSPSFGNTTRKGWTNRPSQPPRDLDSQLQVKHGGDITSTDQADLSRTPGYRRHSVHSALRLALEASRPPQINPSQEQPMDANEDQEEYQDLEPELLLQPETRPIPQEHLANEVKGIYAGLVLVEKKCIDVDGKQATKLTPEQWSALIALHKALLNEHHDFFLASQHPSASPALSKLAEKYSMPARMWKHGIHAFLEVLRHQLPDSRDHMLTFIYISYSMMSLLFETVPAFEDTWVECLGDLGRYRMVIEDEDLRDREVWSGVARFWYTKAAYKSPKVGRLYHHLAILARPFTILQLSLYGRSLTCIIPFENAKGSIRTLFDPVLENQEFSRCRSSPLEASFMKAHALLFSRAPSEEYAPIIQQILEAGLFEKYIGKTGRRFKELGVLIGICNFAALLEYGASRASGESLSLVRLGFEQDRIWREQHLDMSDDISLSETDAVPMCDLPQLTPKEIENSHDFIAQACILSFGMLIVALRRAHDRNVWPLLHVYLVLIWSLCSNQSMIEYVEREIPWSEIVTFFNSHSSQETMNARTKRALFPKPDNNVIGRPLPEDFVLRGQWFSEKYFPDGWFLDAAIDDEERLLELPSMNSPRLERIFWLGHRIASFEKWIIYDGKAGAFLETEYARALPHRTPRPFAQPSDSTRQFRRVEKVEIKENLIPGYDSSRRFEQPQCLDSQQTIESQALTKARSKKTPVILKREAKEDPDGKRGHDTGQKKADTHYISKSKETEDWLKTEFGHRQKMPVKIDPLKFSPNREQISIVNTDDPPDFEDLANPGF